MASSLSFQEHSFLNFRDFEFVEPALHGYRWVDAKHFRFTPGTDGELLSSLIRHVQFRDDYAGGGVHESGVLHGPYWIRHITVDAYELVGETEAQDLLRSWAEEEGTVPQDLDSALSHTAYAPVRSASARYRLRDLGRAAFHDWGGIHCDFHELVLIDRAACILTLLVAADD